MKVHSLQHVPFEGLGSIEAYMNKHAHEVSTTHLYKGDTLPPIAAFDWLIIMGGPMGIHDERHHPWLEAEKEFIRAAIDAGKIVIGICLGAQLIADALGAKVYKNKHREIGWFDIIRNPELNNTRLSEAIPERIEVFHWHGDTFDIPNGARAVAKSDACAHQGFIFNDRVVALQFHLETTLDSVSELINNCGNELDNSEYVQSKDEILSSSQRLENINKIMSSILSALDIKNP